MDDKRRVRYHQAVDRNPRRARTGCVGKVGHTSRRIAAGIARKLAASGEASGLHPYNCAICGKWHLGHEEPSWERKKRGK